MSSRVVTVEIHGQRYPVRSDLDETYVTELAAYVENKMRLASREASAADSMRVAVIAALNIADELFRTRDQDVIHAGTLADRTAALERLIDGALAELPRAKAANE